MSTSICICEKTELYILLKLSAFVKNILLLIMIVVWLMGIHWKNLKKINFLDFWKIKNDKSRISPDFSLKFNFLLFSLCSSSNSVIKNVFLVFVSSQVNIAKIFILKFKSQKTSNLSNTPKFFFLEFLISAIRSKANEASIVKKLWKSESTPKTCTKGNAEYYTYSKRVS